MVYSKLNINKILQAGFYRNKDLFIFWNKDLNHYLACSWYLNNYWVRNLGWVYPPEWHTWDIQVFILLIKLSWYLMINIDCQVSKTGTYTPLSEHYNSQWPWKRGCLLSPCPSWVKEAELGTCSFREFIMTAASRWAELATSLRLVWTAWSHAFLRQDSTEGLYLPCTCPVDNSIDFCSQKPSISEPIHWECSLAHHPGRKIQVLYLSYLSTKKLLSLFSRVFIFVRYGKTRNTPTALNSGSVRNDAT